jgi:hypothetical protein
MKLSSLTPRVSTSANSRTCFYSPAENREVGLNRTKTRGAIHSKNLRLRSGNDLPLWYELSKVAV